MVKVALSQQYTVFIPCYLYSPMPRYPHETVIHRTHAIYTLPVLKFCSISWGNSPPPFPSCHLRDGTELFEELEVLRPHTDPVERQPPAEAFSHRAQPGRRSLLPLTGRIHVTRLPPTKKPRPTRETATYGWRVILFTVSKSFLPLLELRRPWVNNGATSHHIDS